MPSLSIELGSPTSQADTNTTKLTLVEEVNFTTYFFSRDKIRIDMNMLVFFLRKYVRTAAKTMVEARKNQKALTLLYLASASLRNAANSSVVPTEFAALGADNKDEAL